MARDFRFWFNMTLLGLAMAFTLQNVATVEVNFLFWSLQMPRAVLLFVIFIAGAAFGWIASRLHRSHNGATP